MSLPPLQLTQQQIVSWCGQAVYDEALALAKRGEVLRTEYDGTTITGYVQFPNGVLSCRFTIVSSGMITSSCPCYASRERGIVCQHVAAVAITLMQRHADPDRERRYIEEQRRARRKEAFIAQSVARSPDGRRARLLLQLPANWVEAFHDETVEIRCALQLEGEPNPVAPDALGPNRPVRLSEDDDTLLLVLEDIAEERLGGRLSMGQADFINIISLCRGRELFVGDNTMLTVQAQQVDLQVRMVLDYENGELLVFAHTELPFLKPGTFPDYLVANNECWAYGAGHIWPVTPVLPRAYHGLYDDAVVIPRMHVLPFITKELPRLQREVPFFSDIGSDHFSSEPAEPDFLLEIRGSPASLAADLFAVYGDQQVAAGMGETSGVISVPDPDDLFHYWTRNVAAEERGLRRINEAGFYGSYGDHLDQIIGSRAVLNFLGGELPALRRLGWRVELYGKVKEFFEELPMAIPVVAIHPDNGAGNSFEVGISYEDEAGTIVAQREIQRALLHGESFLEREGKPLLLDSIAIESLGAVFRECASSDGSAPGRFKLSGVHAPYVQAALAALDGVDVEQPIDWRDRAARLNRDERLEPESLGELDAVLRPYQKEGVYWLRFIEKMGFAGILADEMGLGKTLQALTWLALPRHAAAARNKPSLMVGPTSLVENWAREAAHFTPGLRTLVMSGSERHANWESLQRYDLIITSYALLRRDLERYQKISFAVAILDEAQHIKNRTTQNAIAAKQLQAEHRLVLSGTPVENSVADLWSILDFLMPNYLGPYKSFRHDYELPIAAGQKTGAEAQQRLRRRVKPFMLRRLKRDVARDLPEKIEKVSYSTLTGDQERVYNVLAERFRRKIGDLVASKGFNRSRMEVLALLMRLRQVCCHLELVPPEIRGREPVEAPSGKLEQFFEILDEALDSGHRMLVFSQFVGMLTLLRRALEARDIAYCYLDGSTHERLAECQRFNRDRSIPLFLISLKAGGTGLNLTGADMVVHFDPWWNPAVEAQATDRAHRIGQKRTVYSIKLISENTIEEKVLALQQKKQAVIDATVGTTDRKMMESLTWEDVQELLS